MFKIGDIEDEFERVGSGHALRVGDALIEA